MAPGDITRGKKIIDRDSEYFQTNQMPRILFEHVQSSILFVNNRKIQREKLRPNFQKKQGNKDRADPLIFCKMDGFEGKYYTLLSVINSI